MKRAVGRRLAVAVLFIWLPAGCAINPATGEPQLALISRSQEIQIGRQSAEQVRQSMAMVDDPELQQYVSGIGQKLAADTERPDLPWAFHVVDDPSPNAFALPGGFIYVTRGMMNLMTNEAELATVLGHEIGHVTARHSVAQMSRQQLAQLGLGVGMILVPEARPLGNLAGLGVNLLMLKYSRDAERQADELGFGYARKHDYDVREMANVFDSLRRVSEQGDQSALPSWFSTHPAPEERIEAVRKRLEGVISRNPQVIVGRDDYLHHIDGIAYGNNPRNGFFREGTFYHPELEFRFSVPADWQTSNLSRAVVAQSPEGDAAAELTLAQGDDPSSALRQFLSQQGIRPGTPAEQTIHGLPAAAAAFQAQTRNTTVTGYATFIGYRGNVYQVLAYAPSGAFREQQQVLEDVAASFAPLDDPKILSVQPATMHIVAVDRTTTLAEFQQKHPSSISMERLAILNELDGGSATIAAGTLVKRVTGDAEFAGG